MQAKIKLRKDTQFKDKFKSYPLQFRIAAVIHDGQWYDKSKWASVATAKVADIEKYIEQNKDVLIERNGSYRTNIDEILKWYKNNNLDIKQPLVPGNFIPKLWGGKTETQQLIDTPKRLVNTLLIECPDTTTKELIKKQLKGYAKVIDLDKKNILRVYTISTDFIEDYLKSTCPEFSKLSIRKRSNVLWRDLSDFDNEFLKEALDFYSNYAKGLLKPHLKTIEIFLPILYDREIQIQEWILRALDKFDETSNIPFSGYLANVLQRWPYDLPNDELGIELAQFQRKRNKALNILVNEYLNEAPPEEEVRQLTDYSEEDYYRLFNEHTQWLSLKSATPLNWEDKNQEKIGRPLFTSNKDPEINPKLSYKLTLALFKATIETNDTASLTKVLDNYTNEITSIDLPEKFKKAIWVNIYEKDY